MIKANLINIIIPISGDERHLEKLRSYSFVTESNFFYFIMVVDESFPTSPTLLENVKRIAQDHFKYCTVVSGSFGSPGGARNAGLKEARDGWIGFWDYDDQANLKEFLEFVKECEISGNSIGAGSFDIQDLRIGSRLQGQILENVDSEDMRFIVKSPGLWRFVFQKSVADGITFPEVRMGEDQVFLLKMLLKVSSIYTSSRVVYTYYIGVENQLTSSGEAILEIPNTMKYVNQINFESIKDRELKLALLIKWNLVIALSRRLDLKAKTTLVTSQILSSKSRGNISRVSQLLALLELVKIKLWA